MSRIKTVFLFLFFFVLVFLGSFFGAKYLLNKEQSTQISASETMILDTLEYETNQNTQPIQTPQIRIESQTTSATQIAPQGEFLLTLDVKNQNYTIYKTEVNQLQIVDEKNSEIKPKEFLFSEKLQSGETISIPFNTWSPDNKYFFLKRSSLNTTEFLVFKATGESFSETPYLNITELFLKKEFPYKIKEVTGWASNTYAVVQTINPETMQNGPSYWFNVYNGGFIQLSSSF